MWGLTSISYAKITYIHILQRIIQGDHTYAQNSRNWCAGF